MPGAVLALFWTCWPFRRGLSIALLGGVVILAACGSSFQQMAAAECQGIATDTAYAECERRLSQQLAEERLGYIVRSQVFSRRAP
jgi:hypothetical protein